MERRLIADLEARSFAADRDESRPRPTTITVPSGTVPASIIGQPPRFPAASSSRNGKTPSAGSGDEPETIHLLRVHKPNRHPDVANRSGNQRAG